MLIYNNKPVFVFTPTALGSDYFKRVEHIWDNTGKYFGSSSFLFAGSKTDFEKKWNDKFVELPDKATLYFGKTSEFPRFKLAETNYRRCIKIEKADVVIVGDWDLRTLNGWELYEGKDNYYLLPDINYSWSMSHYSTSEYKNMVLNSGWSAFLKYKNFINEDITRITTTLYIGNSKSEDLAKVLSGEYTKLVLDKTLDKKINGNFETLDKEAVDSICEMLDSPDATTKGLGLKLLIGYNVGATPLSVRTMLGLRESLSRLPEWKSVGIQQVLNTVNFRGFGRLPNSVYSILPTASEAASYSDYDKSLCKNVYVNALKKYLDQTIDYVNQGGIPRTFNLKVSFNVTES